jgi:hypothetical protein
MSRGLLQALLRTDTIQSSILGIRKTQQDPLAPRTLPSLYLRLGQSAVCTFFGPKVSSSRGGTPLTSLRQRSRLALNMLLKGTGGTFMRPSSQSYRRTKVSNILHPWKKNFALAFGCRPLLSYAEGIPVEMSPELWAATYPLSAVASEGLPNPHL